MTDYEAPNAAHVARLLKGWPPLSDEQLGRVAALLRTDPPVARPEQAPDGEQLDRTA